VIQHGLSSEYQLGAGRGSSTDFLVVDAKPVPWSLQARRVIRIVPSANWDGAAMDLDGTFGGSPEAPANGHVIVLRAHDGTLAVRTNHSLHLESFDSSALLAIPKLAFGGAYEDSAAKHLMLVLDTHPVIVLDIEALWRMANTQCKGISPSITVGEPES